ncbi:MAG: NAD-dependent epimerase/dehydratase family protein [candidate division Zixibacteria bacterium]|nr:NAD-dependent epimerase/dehydratase family protein [candidate division Zixibacteria bacterium]
MKALVTGGAGLIGSHIVDLLLERGHTVRILDNLEPTVHLEGRPAWIPKDAEFIEADVRDESAWERALAGVDTVFHQAAYGGFAPEISKMTAVNALGTTLMFEVIKKKALPIRWVVTASSQAIYGEGLYACKTHGEFHPPIRSEERFRRGQWEVPCPQCGVDAAGCATRESTDADVTGVYSISKYFEERLTLAMGRELGFGVTALRYSLTYGPRQSLFNPYSGICSIFSTRLLNGLAPVIYEDGKQSRDFIFVKDVAAANVLVSEEPRANGRVFNVGTGRATTVADFARKLAKAYGVNIEPSTPGFFRPIDLRHLFANTEQLGALGFKAAHTVDQGIAQYVAWIKSCGQPKEYFTRAEEYLKQLRIVRQADLAAAR